MAMVRRGLVALALGLLCCAHAARAATFLYLRGEPGDLFGVFAEPYRWWDESNASIEVSQPFSGAYVFRFVHTGSGETWSMSWTTNFGGAFTPGVYENPFYLQAAVNGIFCSV